jgi:dynein heavy chain, axonemal
LKVVLSIQPREAGAGGKSPEEVVSEICDDQASRLPEQLTEEHCHENTFYKLESKKEGEEGLTNPLGICLRMEMARFNKLISTIGASLKLLGRAIQGLVVMTGDLDAMFTSLQNNEIPGMWMKVGYPSLKPCSSYFIDFIDRVKFFDTWVKEDLPPSFWISAMYFPQGFLTSVLQSYSRRNQMAVDVS